MLLASVALLGGCASQADLEQLQRNQLQLRSMIAEDRQQIQQLQDRLSQLENAIRETSQSGIAGAPMGRASVRRLNRLEQRVARLEAQLGQEHPAAASTPAPVTSTLPTSPTTNPSGETAAAVVPPTLVPPTPATPPVESEATVPSKVADLNAMLNQELASATSRSGPEARLYLAGLEALKQGKYGGAIAQFSLLKKKYPKSPLNEPAQYFWAAALYQQGRYDESILQFNDLVMRYPTSRFASDALLYEAQAFLKLNDKIDARLTLQKLLADHANSPQAATARQLMKVLE